MTKMENQKKELFDPFEMKLEFLNFILKFSSLLKILFFYLNLNVSKGFFKIELFKLNIFEDFFLYILG